VAQHVGRQLAQGILAEGVDIQLDPGEVALDLRKTGQGHRIQGLLDHHWLRGGLGHLADQSMKPGLRDLQEADDLFQGPGRIRDQPGVQPDREAGRVPGQNPPCTIEDQAPRGRDRRFADHVAARLFQEFLASDDLKVGHSGQEDPQTQQDCPEESANPGIAGPHDLAPRPWKARPPAMRWKTARTGQTRMAFTTRTRGSQSFKIAPSGVPRPGN